MKTFCRTLVVSALALSISGIPLMAQNHHDDQDNRDHQSERNNDQRYNDQHRNHQHRNDEHYVHHKDWRRGSHISHNDWNRGQQVDWHAHHLRQPPRGYAWREVDGNYVLAAEATGLIASVIIASHTH